MKFGDGCPTLKSDLRFREKTVRQGPSAPGAPPPIRHSDFAILPPGHFAGGVDRHRGRRPRMSSSRSHAVASSAYIKPFAARTLESCSGVSTKGSPSPCPCVRFVKELGEKIQLPGGLVIGERHQDLPCPRWFRPAPRVRCGPRLPASAPGSDRAWAQRCWAG